MQPVNIRLSKHNSQVRQPAENAQTMHRFTGLYKFDHSVQYAVWSFQSLIMAFVEATQVTDLVDLSKRNPVVSRTLFIKMNLLVYLHSSY